MIYTIYALADPNTHQVRYVGQTSQAVEVRFKNHLDCARLNYDEPVYECIRSLRPSKPILVELQTVNHTRTIIRGAAQEHKAHAAEVKWMKRFERYNLLQFVNRNRAAYKRLVNP